jgi:predicted NACHT family NTPase
MEIGREVAIPYTISKDVAFVKRAGRFREVGGAATGDLASVLEYYQSLSPGRLVVLGDPGAGKTVLVTELLIRLLEARRHDQDQPVPVLISASAYGAVRAWGDWLSRHLAQRFGISHLAAELLVRDRRILPVVDGIDEMDRDGEPRRAQHLITELNASMRGLERAPVVVTCRYSGYHVLTQDLDRVTYIELVPLTGHEIAGFLVGSVLRRGRTQALGPVAGTAASLPGRHTLR